MLLCLLGPASVLVPFPSSLLNKPDKRTKKHLEGEAGDCLHALSNIGCGRRRREQNDIISKAKPEHRMLPVVMILWNAS